MGIGRTAGMTLAALLLCCAGCRRAQPTGGSPVRPPVEVTLAPVERRAVERTIELTGTLFAQEDAVISSKLAARVAEVVRDLGDEAPSGEVLARLESRDFELEVAQRRATLRAQLARLGLEQLPEGEVDPGVLPPVRQARAEEANAKARLDRAESLYREEPPLVSAEEFEDAKTSWAVAMERAEAEVLAARALLAEARAQAALVDVAQQRVTDATVRTPMPASGAALRYKVAERLVSAGEYVTPGLPMFRIVAADVVRFRGDAPERFSGSLRPGQAARVRVEGDATAYEGVVTRVSPRIDPRNRMFEVEVEIPNPEWKVRPGGFARSEVAFGVEAGVAMVPLGAVVTFAGVQKVFTVRDGKAVETRVELGAREGDLVEVVGGLEAHAVVTGGSAGLTNGAPVKIRG